MKEGKVIKLKSSGAKKGPAKIIGSEFKIFKLKTANGWESIEKCKSARIDLCTERYIRTGHNIQLNHS